GRPGHRHERHVRHPHQGNRGRAFQQLGRKVIQENLTTPAFSHRGSRAGVKSTPQSASACPHSNRHICCTAEDARLVPRRDSCTAAKCVSYSITSSANVSTVGRIFRFSAFAVLRLITSSNLVGCSTGMSAGFTPRRILFTSSAARRYWSGRFCP